MAPLLRKTPLEHPRETLFQKTYSAVIRSDGSVLPIEERLGRRLLRTLPPDSPEGRQLLRKDCVTLLTADGRHLTGLTIEDVYDRLRAETAMRLAEKPRDPDWRRRCKDTLVTIDRWYKALARDH
jgi:hypothetical protein